MADIEIFLKSNAYLDMLAHVLEFGNAGLKTPEDVLGLCIGNVKKNKVIINKIIPMKHGISVDRPFTEVDLIAINESLELEKDELKVGWYRSHCKMGFYMSQSDKKNQLQFQRPDFEYGVFISFDYDKITDEDPLGLKAYQLVNIAKGSGSDFFDVPIEVEAPDGYYLMQYNNRVITAIQDKHAIIEEKGSQLQAEDDLWGSSESEEEKETEEILKLREIIAEFVQNHQESFLGPLISELAKYQKGMNELAKDGSFNNTNIVNLKTELKDGLINVKAWFKQQLDTQYEKNKATFQTTIDSIQSKISTNQKLNKTILKNYNERSINFFSTPI